MHTLLLGRLPRPIRQLILALASTLRILTTITPSDLLVLVPNEDPTRVIPKENQRNQNHQRAIQQKQVHLRLVKHTIEAQGILDHPKQ